MSDEDKMKLLIGAIAIVFIIVLGVIAWNVTANVLEALNQKPFIYGLIVGFVAGGLFSYFGIPAIIKFIKWIKRVRIVKIDNSKK